MEANVVIDGVAYNYHVTQDGRVFSFDYRHTDEIKELKYMITQGYKYACLCKNGKRKFVQVSRLVALAYIPNPDGKPTVDHINRCRTDDRVENLRWANRKEQANNRNPHPKNNKHSKPVMCVETGVVYLSVMEVERQLGFSHSNISNCCNGKRKTVGGFHWQYVEDCDI